MPGAGHLKLFPPLQLFMRVIKVDDVKKEVYLLGVINAGAQPLPCRLLRKILADVIPRFHEVKIEPPQRLKSGSLWLLFANGIAYIPSCRCTYFPGLFG